MCRRLAAAGLLAGLLATAALGVEGDLVFKRAEGDGGGVPPAVFPHWVHRLRYRCYACHPTPFAMKAGATRITKEEMQAGKNCGLCHNGTVAWGVTFETCGRCHVAR